MFTVQHAHRQRVLLVVLTGKHPQLCVFCAVDVYMQIWDENKETLWELETRAAATCLFTSHICLFLLIRKEERMNPTLFCSISLISILFSVRPRAKILLTKRSETQAEDEAVSHPGPPCSIHHGWGKWQLEEATLSVTIKQTQLILSVFLSGFLIQIGTKERSTSSIYQK